MPADAKFLDGGRDQFQGETVIGRRCDLDIRIATLGNTQRWAKSYVDGFKSK